MLRKVARCYGNRKHLATANSSKLLHMKTIASIRLDNLRKLLEDSSLKAIDAAGGGSWKYLDQLLKGTKTMTDTTRGMGDPKARAIEKAMKKPIGWMDNVHDQADQEDYATCEQFELTAAMGEGAVNADFVELRGNLKFKRSFLDAEGIRETNGRVIYARGDSMSPTIPDDSVVLINTTDVVPRHGKVYLISDKEAGLRIKRLARERNGWSIKSDNADETKYAAEPFIGELHTICGRAVWFGARL